MSRKLTPRSTLESLRREAKRWLKALRANDAEARARFERASSKAPAVPGLRDVQLALAREYGFDGWTALRTAVATMTGRSQDPAVNELLEAAGRGDVDHVTAILDRRPELIDARGGEGMRTALHRAVFGEQEAVLTLLLERGADPNVRDEGDHAGPLHFAAEKQHLSMIRRLIEHGADPIGAGDMHELEVIGWATVFGRDPKSQVSEYLLSHGARHNIFSAVATGAVEAIRDIVSSAPADLNRPMDETNHRRRPLHLAVVTKQPAGLAALVELGAQLDALDAAGLTPLDQAALDGEMRIAQALIDHGATIDLPAAIALGRERDVERLLRENPDGLRPGRRWGTLIVRASARAPGEVIEAMIRAGASVDVEDDPRTSVDGTRGYTALHAAAWNGNAAAVTVLLKQGANPRVREDRYGSTPAGWADYAGHRQVRDLILEGAIDLFDAIDFDRTDRIPEILARDPGALNRTVAALPDRLPNESWGPTWCTPLAWAALRSKVEAARILIEHGADRSVRDPEGRTLEELTRAAGSDAVVRVLRSPDAHVAQGHEDDTALMDRFLGYACPDWRVGGPSRRNMYRNAADRLLAQHPHIASANTYTAVVCGALDSVKRFLTDRPEAAVEPGGPRQWPPLLYLCNARISRPDASERAVEIARLLLDRGADANSGYPGGSGEIRYSALTCVIGEGEEEAAPHPRRDELATLLLERGAEPYDTQVLYNTHFRGDILWLMKLIYEHAVRGGRQKDWEDPEWRMLDMQGYGRGARYLLGVAVHHNDLALATWLLEHGASPSAPPPPGWPSRKARPRRSMHEEALRRGFVEMADLLVRHGAAPGTVALTGMEAFVAACLRFDRAEIRALAEHHPEYLRDPAPLFAAIRQDRADIVAFLLELGMSIEIEDEKRTRPLHVAASHDAVRVASLLIERGAEIDAVESNWDNTPLDFAVYHQMPRMIELLGPHSRDLWNLVWIGNVERVREVLAQEPERARIVNRHGATLLMWLPDDEPRAIEMAELLLAHGADPAARDRSGLTAVDRARERGLYAVASLLREG